MPDTIAYKKAIALLHKVSSPVGFLAAAQQEDNYCRVWARDSVVCGLAALLTGDDALINTFKKSLETIWAKQHSSGFLPSNVDVKNNTVSYGGTVGRVDTAAWAIIGLCMYSMRRNDHAFATSFETQVHKAFAVMDVWEFNGKHLMYVPQSADWADEYIQHGYILFDQLLRLWALQLAAKVFANDDYLKKAVVVKKVIQHNFFYRKEEEYWYANNMLHQKENAAQQFWWMGFNPSQIYTQWDLQANALALLLNIGNEAQNNAVTNYVAGLLQKDNSMIASLSPAIKNSDWQMNELKNNFAYRFRNKPGEFHNGGLWPVWNGWMCAALKFHKKENIQQQLQQQIVQRITENNFEMNECYHAQTQAACGVRECAWSAAGVIMAEKGADLFLRNND